MSLLDFLFGQNALNRSRGIPGATPPIVAGPGGIPQSSQGGLLGRLTGGLGNMAGGLLGVGGDPSLLSPEDQAAQARRRQAMAIALLQASGPSTQRTSLGQAFGNALQAGQTSDQGDLQQQLLRAQIEATKAKEIPKPYSPESDLGKLESDFRQHLISQEDYAAKRKLLTSRETPSTNLTVNTGGDYFSSFAKGQADRDAALYEQAQKAPERIQRAAQVKQLLQSGAYTGTAADFKLQFGKAAQALGVDYGQGDATANTEILSTQLASSTLEAIKSSGLGGGTGFSNADRDFLEKVTGGKVTLEKSTLERLSELNDRAARLTINQWNQRYKRIKGASPTQAQAADTLGLGEVSQPSGQVSRGKLTQNPDGSYSYTP